MRLKGAIFDMDGTILDSMFIWMDVERDYLISKGYMPREDLFDAIRSMNLEQTAKYFISEYGLPETPEQIRKEIYDLVSNFYLHEAQLKPGAKEFLEYLHGAGVKMALATATDRMYVEGALRRCGVLDLFDTVCTCGDVGVSKREPDVFFKALATIGTSQADTVVFEDAYFAIKTASNAGFRVVAVYDDTMKDQRAAIEPLVELYIDSYDDLEKQFTVRA